MRSFKRPVKKAAYFTALVIIGFIIAQTVIHTVGFGYAVALIVALSTVVLTHDLNESEAK